MDYEGEDLRALFNATRKGDHSAAGRRKRELKGLSRASRTGPKRDVQLNLRVTAETKALVERLAAQRKLSLPNLIAAAVEALAEADGHAR
jgi:hypothetical protein